jgi:hypothetical protein
MPFSNDPEVVKDAVAIVEDLSVTLKLKQLSTILDSIKRWERYTYWAVLAPPPTELDRIKFNNKYSELCQLLAYALGEYVQGADLCALQQCSASARGRIEGGPQLTPDELFAFSVKYFGTRGNFIRLKSTVMSEISDINPARAKWERRLEEWRELVEPNYVHTLRIIVRAIERAGFPQTQEHLSCNFGNETNVIKRPLAQATKFGLVDKYSKPRGYWPTYLEANPAWTRSVRTKTR